MNYSRLLVLLFACASFDSAFASQVISILRPWQAEVSGAEFVGIVRCIKPGGDYEAVDAWKHVHGESVLKIHYTERYHRIGDEFLALLNTFTPDNNTKKLVLFNKFVSPQKWRMLPDRRYIGNLIELSQLEKRRRDNQSEPINQIEPYDYWSLVGITKSNEDLKRQIQANPKAMQSTNEKEQMRLRSSSLILPRHEDKKELKRRVKQAQLVLKKVWNFKRQFLSGSTTVYPVPFNYSL